MKFKPGILIAARNDERVEYLIVSFTGWGYYIYPIRFYGTDRIQYHIDSEYIDKYYKVA